MTQPYNLRPIWAKYFTSPFPEGAQKFWARYSDDIVEIGIKSLAKKCTTSQFKNQAEASRYATGVMKAEFDNRTAEKLPAPTVVANV